MNDIESTIARIRAYAEHMRWKKSRFAKEAGFSTDRTLKDFHNEDWNPTADTLRRLEKVIPKNFPLRERNTNLRPAPKGTNVNCQT